MVILRGRHEHLHGQSMDEWSREKCFVWRQNDVNKIEWLSLIEQ